jgi:hypothetical protein
MGRLIPFRIRDGKDDDIDQALQQASKTTSASDVIREALRAFLLGGSPGSPKIVIPSINNFELERKEKDVNQLEGDLEKLINDF